MLPFLFNIGDHLVTKICYVGFVNIWAPPCTLCQVLEAQWETVQTLFLATLVTQGRQTWQTKGVTTACDVCYEGKEQGTGEVQGDPLAGSPEEEGRISPPCELSSKAFWCPLGTLGKYWSAGVPWQFVFYREHFSRIHCIISTSTFSDDLIFHCWTFRLVLLAYERCRNDQEIKTEKQQRLLFFTQEKLSISSPFLL